MLSRPFATLRKNQKKRVLFFNLVNLSNTLKVGKFFVEEVVLLPL
jgi:hypothetical protein